MVHAPQKIIQAKISPGGQLKFDFELGGDENLHEGSPGEVFVLGVRMGAFVVDHTGEETKEEWFGEILRTDALTPQFVQERSVATIDSSADTSQVLVTVVGGDTVDVVDGLAGWNVFFSPGGIDSSRGEHGTVITPRMFELEILCFAVRIAVSAFDPSGVDMSFGAVGKELHADDASVSVVDIERDAVVRTCVLSVIGHEFDKDVVVVERFRTHSS